MHSTEELIHVLTATAIKGLSRYYRQCPGGFHYTVRPDPQGRPQPRGYSVRYAAISQIGVSQWRRHHPADPTPLPDLHPKVADRIHAIDDIGDAALWVWASCESGHDNAGPCIERLVQLWESRSGSCNAVEFAWVLMACVKARACCPEPKAGIEGVMRQADARLGRLFSSKSSLFRRYARDGWIERVDGRIACFADQVYPILIGAVNAAKLVKAWRDPQLRRSLNDATFTVADGVPVVWLSRLCGCALPERVAGIDIMNELLALADRRGYGVYFLGARQDTVERVVQHVRRTYPGVRIAGYRNGYFSSQEEWIVAQTIRASRADILLVAVPTPQKENFLRRWRDDIDVPVCHGVGGSFDVVAGVTQRAPVWMQKLGLEWLYRVMQEPRRMWKRYLVTNAIFIGLAVQEVVRARLRLRRRHMGPAPRKAAGEL